MSTSRRRIRFAVVNEVFSDRRGWLDHIRRLEQSGVDTVLIRDHIAAAPFGPQLAPLAMAATAAAHTTRLRVGTMVLSNDYRHPALVAHEAATIDWLSGGRLELGLGAGWLRGEYDQMGISFDVAGTRIARLEEAARVIAALLAGETVTLHGAHYTIDSLHLPIMPIQQPRPPLVIGGGGPKMLALAARRADIVGILPAPIRGDDDTDDAADRSPAALDAKLDVLKVAAGGAIPRTGTEHLRNIRPHQPTAPRHRIAHRPARLDRDHLRRGAGHAVGLHWITRADPRGPAGTPEPVRALLLRHLRPRS